MLDIRLIRENSDFVRERLATRGSVAAFSIDLLLEADAKRRQVDTFIQGCNARRKTLSKEIGIKRSNGLQSAELEAQVRSIGEEIARWTETLGNVQQNFDGLIYQIPNLPHPHCPIGSSPEDNPLVRTWGEKPAFSFAPKSHIELGEKLGLFDFERAVKITGSAFAVYMGAGARLERTLINSLLDVHTREHGYTEVSPPLLVKAESLVGTSQLPKFEDQLYRCERDELYLAPTAEVPVTNLHREEILRLEQLPIKYAAYTPCFRREAGSARLGTRALIRTHPFHKDALVKNTTPQSS